MDTVPRLFVEKVLLCLRDHPSLRELYTIPALWGEVCTASCQKIHTLDVFVHSEIGRLYTAAQPFWLENQKVEFFSGFLHKPHKGRRSHNWKFLTHFRIRSEDDIDVNIRNHNLSNKWKERTAKELQKLCHFIRPTTKRRARSWFESSNTMHLLYCSKSQKNFLLWDCRLTTFQ
uniref:F-box domain-containing protein n=1 Tax=Steinernema glaseri TaxID=37863 RepID=A0A1I7Z5A8_9BILA